MSPELGECHHSQLRKGQVDIGVQIQATEQERLKRTGTGRQTRKTQVSHRTGGRANRL